MKLHHLELLCDPKTGDSFEVEIKKMEDDEIVEGILTSQNNIYKIYNGIPRFVDEDNYSNNFGWQWNKWARIQFEDENVGGSMEGYTRNMFHTISEFTKERVNEKIVLDIGCGPGRFSDIILEMGGIPILLDHSNAIDACKENFKEKSNNILFMQGDALALPLKSESVDFAFSIGVLHHTPNPKQGVAEAYRVLKPNGDFAISVYSKDSYYTFSTVSLWRKVFKSVWPLFKHYPPLIYSNLFGRLNHYLGKINIYLTYPIRFIFPTIVLPDLKWSVLDTFDSITTSYQSGHTIYEVFKWFEDIKFSRIRPGNWRVNIIGTK